MSHDSPYLCSVYRYHSDRTTCFVSNYLYPNPRVLEMMAKIEIDYVREYRIHKNIVTSTPIFTPSYISICDFR